MTTPINARDLVLQQTSPRLLDIASNGITLVSPNPVATYNANNEPSPSIIEITALLSGVLKGQVTFEVSGLVPNTSLVLSSQNNNKLLLDPNTFFADTVIISAKLLFEGFEYVADAPLRVYKVYPSSVIRLSRAFDNVASDINGNNYTLPGINYLELYNGPTNKFTTGVVFGPVTQTKNGLTCTVNTTSGEVTFTQAQANAWTSDYESFTLTATRNFITYSITYTINKLREGGTGIDSTPPPTPTNFQASPGINTIQLSHDASTYTQGSGHRDTVIYGKIFNTGDTLTPFNPSEVIGQFTGNVYALPSEPGTTWRLWIKWRSNDGYLSTVPAGELTVTTGQDVAKLRDILTGELTESQLTSTLTSRINLIDDPVTGLVKKTNDLVTTYGSTASAADSAAAATQAKADAIGAKTEAVQAKADAIIAQGLAAGSASTATTQAELATSAKDAAGTSATNAATSATSAATSATNAAGSASTATTQAELATSAKDAAGTSATNAATSATSAATSATNAAGSASTATTQAELATSDKDAAGSSARIGATSATTAATSATNAAGSSSTATTQAELATSAKDAAGTSATNAGVSATNAATSATNAAGSASSAASSLLEVQSSNATALAAVQTLATTTAGPDGATAQYTVKTDVNGNVAGFGLSNTANTAGAATSEFTIIADKFAIAAVNTDNTAVDGSPFFHRTVATTINGVVIPAGTYMKAAFIHDATITNAKIANLAVDNAKIADLAVDSAKIANLAVTNAKIDNLAVDNAKIQNLAVDNAKIANASIQSAKIATLDADLISTGTLRAGVIDVEKLIGSSTSITAIGSGSFTVPPGQTKLVISMRAPGGGGGGGNTPPPPAGAVF